MIRSVRHNTVWVATLISLTMLMLSMAACTRTPATARTTTQLSATPIVTPTPKTTPIPYVWNDEFNGSSLDTTKWTPLHGGAFFTPPTLEYYADDAITVHDGMLVLTAAHRDMGGYQYTSGGVSSRGKFSFQYGILDIRYHLPVGSGFWPALWMMPTDGTSRFELDVMEYYSLDVHTISMVEHYRDTTGQNHSLWSNDVGGDMTNTDHIVTLDWEPHSLRWYMDGQLYLTVTDHVPNTPMFLYMNDAIGSLGGDPDAMSFPATFQIDYVRVRPSTEHVATKAP